MCFLFFSKTLRITFLNNSCYILMKKFALSAAALKYSDGFSEGGLDPSPNKCPGYNSKQYDGEVPVMLEIWGIRSTPKLSSLPGPLWPGVEAPDSALSMDQMELKCILMLSWIAWKKNLLIFKLYLQNRIVWKKKCFDS